MNIYTFIGMTIFLVISMVLSYNTWKRKSQILSMMTYYSWAIFTGLIFSTSTLYPLFVFMILASIAGNVKQFNLYITDLKNEWKWNWKTTFHVVSLFTILSWLYFYTNGTFMSSWDFSQHVIGRG